MHIGLSSQCLGLQCLWQCFLTQLVESLPQRSTFITTPLSQQVTPKLEASSEKAYTTPC